MLFVWIICEIIILYANLFIFALFGVYFAWRKRVDNKRKERRNRLREVYKNNTKTATIEPFYLYFPNFNC